MRANISFLACLVMWLAGEIRATVKRCAGAPGTAPPRVVNVGDRVKIVNGTLVRN
jgi:hypothetical protein